jgi:molybdopterin converting factor small subunit
MYPKPMTYTVEKPMTLREFISTLGEHTLYAYDRRVIGVVVNEKKLWDSAKLKSGDKVTIFPIIVGG